MIRKYVQFSDKLQIALTRQFWRKIHRYFGWVLGFWLALIGFTGSLCVYQAEIDRLLNPELTIAQPQGSYQSLDKILAAVKAAQPNRHGSWTLELPQAADEMLTAWFEKPQETYFENYAPLMVSVNPYTAEVVASRFWGQTASTWLLDMHSQLRLGRLGWQSVGALGGLMMLAVVSGLVLWWPSGLDWRNALKLRCHEGGIRLMMDLHRWLGVTSASALLVLAFTGMQLSFPEIFSALADAQDMGHGNSGKPVLSTASPNNRPIRLDEAEFIARGSFPRATLRRVTTPQGEQGAFRINLRQNWEINHKHPYTQVWVDRWSGHIRTVRDPAEFNAGERTMMAIWPVHTGEALGAGGRFAWFVAGLCPGFFLVSGLLHSLLRHGRIQDHPIPWLKLHARLLKLAWQLKTGVVWVLPKLLKAAQWLLARRPR